MTIAMWILALLTCLSALGVVVVKKPLNSALWLIVTLFLIAAHYAVLGAHFVAAAQVLVYAGAIMVLIIFVIMLLGLRGDEKDVLIRTPLHIPLIVLVGAFMTLLMHGVDVHIHPFKASGAEASAAAVQGLENTEAVGQLMFTKFMYPFELTSLLLLAAIIGAVLLSYERKRALGEGRGLRATAESS